ncbi:SDR family oxidoreductase [Ornithinimicrobium sp. F0845]|uniref:SDR family NAD(P)-dependent oxidoreductase n=1 Tax=Ornithinimicrobium sp. F0845 TaxID=2926412 RepID=UPI001FF30DB0|nr:SDR family oxidoreductase [Ornithinimicrobium sp. F0845]MCK0112039.1 SDR family oxidoreductase [Ornithinimicrobium sp. F0845]
MVSDDMARVAVVTGSSTGIGAAIAKRLSREGFAVAVVARAEERTSATVGWIRDNGGTAHGFAADLSRPEEIEDLFTQFDARFERLDALVNNAGMASIADSTSVPLRHWNRVLTLNLTAPFVAAQCAHPRMTRHGGGVIVNIGSVYSGMSVSRRAAYVTSKHGLIGLTKTLATEWAPDGVRVVAVAPGYTETDHVRVAMEDGGFDAAAVVRRTPMGRLAHVDEVADAVSFVCSERASFVTGSTLYVDGGWTGYGGV